MKVYFLLIIILIFNTLTGQNYKSVEVGFTTTVHLIFPSEILNFDVGLGSVGDYHDILVEKSGNNRLKLAAGVRDFTSTNLFIETDDGYYNFMLVYSDKPEQLIINIKENEAQILKNKPEKPVQNEESTKKSNDEAYKTLCIKSMEKTENTFIYSNSALGILFTLNAIYVHEDKLVFKFTVKNNSNVKYEVGYLGYVVHKKGKGRRQGVVTDEVMQPIYTFQEFNELQPEESKNIVSVFDKFTLDKKKKFIISIWEKAGERKIDLTAKPVQIVNAVKL